MDNPEIYVDTNFCWDSIDLRIRADRLSINHEVVKPGVWVKESTFVEVEEGATPPVAFQLGHTQAQALMDRLWKAGLRPTEGSGSAGALAATQDHLKDMRTLVFDKGAPRRGLDDNNSLYRKLTGEE